MLLGKEKQSLPLPKPISSQDKSASWLYLPFTDREREKFYGLKSDFHHLVQCRAAASVCKRKRGRRGSTGSARLDQGPLQVPLQPTPSTWLYTQGSCDKAISVTVLLCASGRYEKVKCIWMRGDHLVQITFRLKKTPQHCSLPPVPSLSQPQSPDPRSILCGQESVGCGTWFWSEWLQLYSLKNLDQH